MNSSVQFLIFDLDGTLIDSKRDIVLCVNRALVDQGLMPLDEEKIGNQIGRGTEYLFRQLLGTSVSDSEIKTLVERCKHFYSKHLLDHTCVYPGVHETLQFFRTLPKVIVTNKNQEFADSLVNKLGLKTHFEAVFGSEAFPTQKPDSGPILKTCAVWKTEPSQAVIIGDSVFDITAGKMAAVKTVAALYGFTKAEELRRQSPDYEIESAHDLPGILADP